ncbi:hypothetical protein BZG36_03909 [Bifiguratus adelaidae]|uniref:Uncharacterized protein n=1 Tax=Bifiguratus adelaidae TaxID=1938954 RepID=A0A261XXI3_9FUNG|nr:hypothetical protein BZG36_03909 [Bifiguratus adelaidae]
MQPTSNSLLLNIDGPIATITINRPSSLNSLGMDGYKDLASFIVHLNTLPEIVFIVITGTGKYFSSGADVKAAREVPPEMDKNLYYRERFDYGNGYVTRVFADNTKILVFALNGPAVGLSAALTGHADMIYMADNAFIMTPFASIGLVAEGAASATYLQKMGLTLATEALVFDTKLTPELLLARGYINKILPPGEAFLETVKQDLLAKLEGKNRTSILEIH